LKAFATATGGPAFQRVDEGIQLGPPEPELPSGYAATRGAAVQTTAPAQYRGGQILLEEAPPAFTIAGDAPADVHPDLRRAREETAAAETIAPDFKLVENDDPQCHSGREHTGSEAQPRMGRARRRRKTCSPQRSRARSPGSPDGELPHELRCVARRPAEVAR
jgi:hypothetical protein